MNDLHDTDTTARRSMMDRLRIDLYLMRLDWHLEGGLPGAGRKNVIRSLRDDLLVEPRSTGAALRDLGPASGLAARYGDEGMKRPLWSIGIITAGAALLVYWALFLSYVWGMLAAVDDAGAQQAHSAFLFLVPVTAFDTEAGVGIGWSSGLAWLVVPLVITLLAFALGARLWRLTRRRNRRG
ncbi:MAG: hypothetical protein L0J68_07070 [Micrococcaceae bacterium]|uniref:hypothetical protein n=1 Tax=Arthrobacter sp. 179 TaxID=3457734 RepID=UPI002656106A|nr:hypothetical protein [Micrococcaceae bacterium]MDN5823994.1 hypothetical protein [Micrococcaceae bacterium]MDN5879150.1 hypothetical protein [Micrococcaceae bacterium]MDN5886626.1 hypothetical protein [Micrococcaceae bacterium]MDN5905772.1 hypothetical protein [Micrococcaceae bacterium]